MVCMVSVHKKNTALDPAVFSWLNFEVEAVNRGFRGKDISKKDVRVGGVNILCVKSKCTETFS
jgi:hypothetical protein